MPENVGKKAKGPKKPKAPGAGLIGPLTLRDILLLVAGLFALVALATPGYAIRVQGISAGAEWFLQRWAASTIGYVVLGVLPVLVAAVLTLVNKLTGSIRLIGSLSVDQLISVLSAVAFAMNFVWLVTMATNFHVGSVFGFLAAIIAFVAGTLTVIPVFGKEFAYRAATDAHPKARPYSKSAATQGPVVGAQGGPNAQVAHMAQPGIPGQGQGAGQVHGAGQAQGTGQAHAGSQPDGGFGSQPGSQFAPGPASQSGAGADEPALQPASGPGQPWAAPSGQQVTAGGGAGYGAEHGAFAPQNESQSDSQSAGAQPGQAQHNGQAGQGETPGQPWAQQSQPGEQTSQPWVQNGGQPNQPGDLGQPDQGDKGQSGQGKKDEDTFHTSDDEQAYLGRHSAKEPRYAQNQPTQAFMTGGKENQTSDQPGGPWAQSAATSGSAVGEAHKTDASQNTDASQKADQSETAAKSKDASEADGAEGAGSRSAGAAAGVAGAGVAAGATGVTGVAGAAGASDVSGSTGEVGVAGATGTTGAAGATGATGDAQPQNPWAKPGAPTEAGREHEVANTSGTGANAQDDAPGEPDARGDAASRVADDNEPTQYFRPYEYSEQGFEPVDGSGNQETQVAHAVQPQQGFEAQAQPQTSEPFWFAVPEPRPAVDATTGETVFMVTPGEWFLATENRGASFVVHNSAQQEGILHNVSDVILP